MPVTKKEEMINALLLIFATNPANIEIDDEEFEHQNERLKWGLTPDTLDIGEYKDSILRGGAVK